MQPLEADEHIVGLAFQFHKRIVLLAPRKLQRVELTEIVGRVVAPRPKLKLNPSFCQEWAYFHDPCTSRWLRSASASLGPRTQDLRAMNQTLLRALAL